MRITRALAVLGATGTLVAGMSVSAVPVSAADAWQEPQIAWVNKNIVTTDGGEESRLLVKYRCWGTGVHLWGSAKQGPDIDPAAGQTTSDFAESWRETPEGPTPTCDGKWHTEKITLQDTPDTASHDPLTEGAAWMQFVIFSVGDNGEFGRAAAEGWRYVRGNG